MTRRLYVGNLPYDATEKQVRQVFENDDFGEAFTPELREQEERIRTQVTAKR